MKVGKFFKISRKAKKKNAKYAKIKLCILCVFTYLLCVNSSFIPSKTSQTTFPNP